MSMEDIDLLNYRVMTIDDYEAVYDLWIKCGNGLNNKDDSREDLNYRNKALVEMVRIDPDYVK